MPASLTLLGDVRWNDTPVAGDRSRALLAALAADGGRPVPAERLVHLIWRDEPLANAAKSLQVVVSRTRAACGGDAIVRDGEGYRLGVGADDVDAARLRELVAAAGAAIARDAHRAAQLAREALALGADLQPAGAGDEGPLADLRRAAAGDLAAARLLSAQAASRTGAHAEALGALEAAWAEHPGDESLLADLLRSEAAVRGPGAALDRYERHRRDLRDRLGTNPGATLQRVHGELLALDRPIRSGIRHDATALLGRDDDVEQLRALVAGSRLVSILGPGGLGKTRLAHVLARDAVQPIVHVVELVGVTAPEDLVGEIGSAIGVRDSVSSRRALTPEQRADVRGRIAQRLDQSASLLILDNCEHIVAAVAELVAFLVANTADLRIVTTTRARLGLAAERVYPLGELADDDAVELFRQRALAARPGAQLEDAVVRRIVRRLDGLPLAIELAAAKVRAMAAEDIDRRLEDRFALLRGEDRSAPDRHRTLLAVIDWSWNLLAAPERRALRWLSLFPDGFTLDAADEALGDGALGAVQGLVDQSLLGVRETCGSVRYRMLETVREFGWLQLDAAGERDAARSAVRAWATGFAARHGRRLFGPDQFDAIDAIAAEESNLADELRAALTDGDPAATVRLIATLGGFWAIRGEHERGVALVGAFADVVCGWEPSPELAPTTVAALVVALGHAMVIADGHAAPLRELLARVTPTAGADPQLAAVARVLLAHDPQVGGRFPLALDELVDDPDRHTALAALQWAVHMHENAGDPAAAATAAERALALTAPEDGPWTAAILHTELAQLRMQLSDRAAAMAHARAALPTLERLGTSDDVAQLHALCALAAIADGRLDDAERELDAPAASGDARSGGRLVSGIGRAELALARGDAPGGLALYVEVAETMRALRMPGIDPTGLEPWVLFAEATALTALAHYATTAEHDETGRTLFRSALARGASVLDPRRGDIDYPVCGMLLFALGSWGLCRGALAADDAVTLLTIAERFAYNRAVPTMAWERIAPRAEAAAPGVRAALRERLGAHPPAALLGEAHDLVERLAA